MKISKKIILILVLYFIQHEIFGQDSAVFKFVCDTDSYVSHDKILLLKKGDWFLFQQYRQINKLSFFDTASIAYSQPISIINLNDSFIVFSKGIFFKISNASNKSVYEISYSDKPIYSDDMNQERNTLFDLNNNLKYSNSFKDIMSDLKSWLNGYTFCEKDTLIQYENHSIDCWKVNFIANKDRFDVKNSDLVDREFFLSKKNLFPLLIRYKIPQNIKPIKGNHNKHHFQVILPPRIFYKEYVYKLEYLPLSWL